MAGIEKAWNEAGELLGFDGQVVPWKNVVVEHFINSTDESGKVTLASSGNYFLKGDITNPNGVIWQATQKKGDPNAPEKVGRIEMWVHPTDELKSAPIVVETDFLMRKDGTVGQVKTPIYVSSEGHTYVAVSDSPPRIGGIVEEIGRGGWNRPESELPSVDESPDFSEEQVDDDVLGVRDANDARFGSPGNPEPGLALISGRATILRDNESKVGDKMPPLKSGKWQRIEETIVHNLDKLGRDVVLTLAFVKHLPVDGNLIDKELSKLPEEVKKLKEQQLERAGIVQK